MIPLKNILLKSYWINLQDVIENKLLFTRKQFMRIRTLIGSDFLEQYIGNLVTMTKNYLKDIPL